MSSPLLALAIGALKGANANREERRTREEEELERSLRLRATPGVTLEDPAVGQTRSALDVAGSLVGAMGAGPGAVMTPPQAPAVGTSAGHVQLGGKSMDVRFDPTQTVEGRRVAQDQSNRASHARLQKVDPTLWNQTYDPNYDYGGAERDEQKKAHTEQQLVAAGWDAQRAKLFARTGFDSEKRAGELEARQQAATRLKLEERRTAAAERAAGASAANAEETRTDRRAKASEGDAVNTAVAWALEGKRQKIDDSTLQQQIAEALPAMYPELSAAQRAGVAAQAMLKRDESRARIGARDRSGTKTPGLKIPGVGTLPSTAATAPVKPTAPADPAKARKKAIEDLVDAGKSKEEIKAELKRRGL